MRAKRKEKEETKKGTETRETKTETGVKKELMRKGRNPTRRCKSRMSNKTRRKSKERGELHLEASSVPNSPNTTPLLWPSLNCC